MMKKLVCGVLLLSCAMTQDVVNAQMAMDMSTAGAEDVVWTMADTADALKRVCIRMPFMTACSLGASCMPMTAEDDSSSSMTTTSESKICSGYALLTAACSDLGMSNMMGCRDTFNALKAQCDMNPETAYDGQCAMAVPLSMPDSNPLMVTTLPALCTAAAETPSDVATVAEAVTAMCTKAGIESNPVKVLSTICAGAADGQPVCTTEACMTGCESHTSMCEALSVESMDTQSAGYYAWLVTCKDPSKMGMPLQAGAGGGGMHMGDGMNMGDGDGMGMGMGSGMAAGQGNDMGDMTDADAGMTDEEMSEMSSASAVSMDEIVSLLLPLVVSFLFW